MQTCEKLAVTVPEAVKLSGIGTTSLYAIFKDGKIKPRKMGRRTLVLVSDLKAYLEGLPTSQEVA